MKSCLQRSILIAATYFSIASTSLYAVGPAILLPCKFESRSRNGKFIAEVTPAGEYIEFSIDQPGKRFNPRNVPFLRMFEADDSSKEFRWQIDLSNEKSPTELFVTDDGQYAVTVGDRRPPRVAKDYLAFYDRNGQIKKYSLDQVKSLYGNKKTPQLSSVKMLTLVGNTQCFCIWSHTEFSWLGWSVSNGNLVTLNDSTINRLNLEARRWALETIRNGRRILVVEEDNERADDVFLSTEVTDAYEFVSALKDARDRN